MAARMVIPTIRLLLSRSDGIEVVPYLREPIVLARIRLSGFYLPT
jgi:hypothetical protein